MQAYVATRATGGAQLGNDAQQFAQGPKNAALSLVWRADRKERRLYARALHQVRF